MSNTDVTVKVVAADYAGARAAALGVLRKRGDTIVCLRDARFDGIGPTGKTYIVGAIVRVAA